MITFLFRGTEKLKAMKERAKAAKIRFRERVIKASNDFSQIVLRSSKEKYLSGVSDDILHVRTGNLRRNIRSQVAIDGDQVSIAWGTDVKYGPIHEFGGPVPTRNRKSFQMPMRSFLRRPLEDKIDSYKNTLTMLMGDLERDLLNGI